MIVVLTGANDFARTGELSRITADFIKQYGDFGLEKIDASEIELGRLLESVQSLPFLATRRMIILSDPGSDKAINEHIDVLLDAVADTTDLIIVESKFDKRLSLYKMLKKRADFREFAEMDERSLPKWLSEEAKKRGGVLSLADATYLIERIGTNQLGASNELDKLLLYDPHVTKETINLLTEPLPDSSVFELLDAVFSGNTKKAIKLYTEQRAQQVEPQAIMGMIAWQMHVIAVVKANEQLGPEAIARAAKLNPFVVRKTLATTQRMSFTDVKKLLSQVLELDVRLKSEALDADAAIQHLLLTI